MLRKIMTYLPIYTIYLLTLVVIHFSSKEFLISQLDTHKKLLPNCFSDIGITRKNSKLFKQNILGVGSR